MKSKRRRSRVIAGFALVAASVAVSAAMVAPATGSALPAPHRLGAQGATLSAQHPITRLAGRTPLGRDAASGKRAARDAGTSGEGLAPLAAERIVLAQEGTGAGGSAASTWWLEYAGACSRTRGRPGMDVRT